MIRIQEGDCSCLYFTNNRIPCKHLFSIFLHFKWEWEDLPASLTESPFMMLDSSILQDECTNPPPADEEKLSQGNSTPIPLRQSAGSKLLCLQKQVRDELAKCSAAVFMIDNISMLESVQRKVHDIHSELLTAASTGQAKELPVIKNFAKQEVEEYRKKAKLLARANRLTWRSKQQKWKRNRGHKMPIQRPSQKDDPLNAAARPSVGRPKGKKRTMSQKGMGAGTELFYPSSHTLFSLNLALKSSGIQTVAASEHLLGEYTSPKLDSNKVLILLSAIGPQESRYTYRVTKASNGFTVFVTIYLCMWECESLKNKYVLVPYLTNTVAYLHKFGMTNHYVVFTDK